ncbi:hypothetical protein QYF61_023472 [Mycteria americana]|uniref:Uncharacterized protein n=1 Tax=Mycteria americana TaxID=33587 RepID=A0AAN7S4D7_MYCAM|nr:hypothetical protein QYF61_023472 [Mycteria americana]
MYISLYIYLMGVNEEKEGRLFLVVPSDRTNVNVHKLKHRKFHLNIRKSFFTVRVLECWHRVKKTPRCSSSWERGVRTCERNNSADTKVSEEGGGGGAPGTGAEIPLQPVVKTMVRQAVPLQPTEVHGGADIYLQPVEDPMLEQVDAPEGGCDPMGSLRWSRLLAGPVDSWREEPRLEQVCWQHL